MFTTYFRARVDVHRKDNVGSVEKAITIYGQPENCSNACLQILKVMQEEARNTEKSDDIPLKILAHNNLIGRIIGKQGSTIKKIMEETDTKITVSSINDINSYNLERIITIRGEPENISRAEAEISAKLRQAFESDINSLPVSFQGSFFKLFFSDNLYIDCFRHKMSCFPTCTQLQWCHPWAWVWHLTHRSQCNPT